MMPDQEYYCDECEILVYFEVDQEEHREQGCELRLLPRGTYVLVD